MRIAIVDDEAPVGRNLRRAFTKEGHEVQCFLDGRSFLKWMAEQPFDLVFLDLRLPDLNGMEILERLKERQQDAEVIIITAYGSIDSAIEAIKIGAYHYVTKPIKLDEIRLLAKSALERLELRRENRRLRKALEKRDIFDGFIGNSPVMQELFAMIKKVAAVDCNVLIQGESGTGKELVARSIHALSPRKEQPFVSFNCGGFTEELLSNELFGHEKGAFTGASATKIGLLEAAAGGTVFLDEIAEMSPSMQVKLLHVIQEKRILRVGGTRPVHLDIRIIAASNKDIKKELSRGTFREDLFYRLNVVTLWLPRLADRKDDLPLLVTHFIDKHSRAFGKKAKKISPRALDILAHYSFPGNVRELENIIERAVALSEGESIRVKDLPSDLQNLEIRTFEGESLPTLEEVERDHITRVLAKTGHNKGLTARVLNLPRTTLWRKMRKYGLGEDQ